MTGHRSLIDGLTCHPKDRYVLAAAVRANAGAIITFNTTDFPDRSVEQYAIEVIHPDTFLLDLLDLAPARSSTSSHGKQRPTAEPRGRSRRSSTRSNEPEYQRSPTRSDDDPLDPQLRRELPCGRYSSAPSQRR